MPKVQKRLSHTDVKTTMNICNHVYKRKDEDVVGGFLIKRRAWQIITTS